MNDKSIRLRIVSNGNVLDTRVIDENTGRTVGNIKRIEIEPLDADKPDFVNAKIFLFNVPLDIELNSEALQLLRK